MLWLALHLPRFAVEIHAARPPAVTVARTRVVAADQAAEAAGIVLGMRLSSALGLAPGLVACPPDPRRQAAALACWAGSFTPQVSLAPPNDAPEDLPGTSAWLFGAGGMAAIAPTVERLRARLGQEAVQGLAVVADHRPEQATRAVDWPTRVATPPAPPRPSGCCPHPAP